MKRIPLDLAPARANAQDMAQSAYEREERRSRARQERVRRQWLARRDERRAWRYDVLDEIADLEEMREDVEEGGEYESRAVAPSLRAPLAASFPEMFQERQSPMSAARE